MWLPWGPPELAILENASSQEQEHNLSASQASAQARRVVTGLDASGRSAIVSDGLASARLMTPGNTKCDIWRLGSLHVPQQPSLPLSPVGHFAQKEES
jgi:hypothetical protein